MLILSLHWILTPNSSCSNLRASATSARASTSVSPSFFASSFSLALLNGQAFFKRTSIFSGAAVATADTAVSPAS